jgi:hypothetical protein
MQNRAKSTIKNFKIRRDIACFPVYVNDHYRIYGSNDPTFNCTNFDQSGVSTTQNFGRDQVTLAIFDQSGVTTTIKKSRVVTTVNTVVLLNDSMLMDGQNVTCPKIYVNPRLLSVHLLYF